jgi:hypothetical protein
MSKSETTERKFYSKLAIITLLSIINLTIATENTSLGGSTKPKPNQCSLLRNELAMLRSECNLLKNETDRILQNLGGDFKKLRETFEARVLEFETFKKESSSEINDLKSEIARIKADALTSKF